MLEETLDVFVLLRRLQLTIPTFFWTVATSFRFDICIYHKLLVAGYHLDLTFKYCLENDTKFASNVSLSLFIHELKTTRTKEISRGVHCYLKAYKPLDLLHITHESAGKLTCMLSH